MATPHIKILRPSGLRVDPDKPFVFHVEIPIALPHRIDPSLPAPPYHEGTITAHDFRDNHAMPLLRQLVPGVVSKMFGPDHAAAALVAQALSEVFPMWDCDEAVNRDDFDLAAGRWKDRSGIEHHPIHAYDVDFDYYTVYRGFRLFLICGIRNPKKFRRLNPRVIRCDVVKGVGEESWESEEWVKELVFEVKEYGARFRYMTINAALEACGALKTREKSEKNAPDTLHHAQPPGPPKRGWISR